jgi:succinate dehydrogenase / fumarate reductase membrane anchor subunit
MSVPKRQGPITYGSQRTVVGAHYGMRDWLSQRVTAVLMALFTVAVVVQVLLPGPLDYTKWSAIFAHQWMKVLTFSVIAGLLWHVWVGMRDVLMDYVKPIWMRLSLQVFVIVWLTGCAGWAIQALWRV